MMVVTALLWSDTNIMHDATTLPLKVPFTSGSLVLVPSAPGSLDSSGSSEALPPASSFSRTFDQTDLL